MADEPTNARNSFGDIAPQRAKITDKVLFGQVWEDETLSPVIAVWSPSRI